MNKIAESKLKTTQPLYIPLKEFHEKVSEVQDEVYPSELSFAPIFEKFRETKEKNIKNSPETFTFFEDFENQLLEISDLKGAKDRTGKIKTLINLLFPALFFEGQMGFITTPFSKGFTFMTPAMEEMFSSGKEELKLTPSLMNPKASQTVLQAGSFILSKFYKQGKGLEFSEKMCIRDKETQLEKYFKINIITDFIKIIPQKPLKKLSNEQIFQLHNEWDNEELWLKCFPPENFSFEGMVIGYLTDVTDVEIMSLMKERLVQNEDPKTTNHVFEEITQLLRSYLQMPEINFGSLQSINTVLQTSSSWSVIGNADFLTSLPKDSFEKGLYGKVAKSREPVMVGDLSILKSPSVIDKILMEKGFQSLLLAPLFDNDEKLIGIFELVSKKPWQFSKKTLVDLKEAIDLFQLGNNRWLGGLKNQVNLFIQQQFTSIHPSVEWKFVEVSKKFLWGEAVEDDNMVLEPVVFKNIYPLYAQADIVGSSTIRNNSIESDLIDNLERVQKVIKTCRGKLRFHLLDVYLSKVEENLERLKRGEFVSSDESQIVDLLTREIHPLLVELQNNHKNDVYSLVQKYFEYLDPRLNIVYRKRKDYEDSVSFLNQTISDFIEQEDAKKQQVLPHFFEKYTTDGVEYNIYIGESLLENGGFSDFYLKDFRLWQMIKMCEITRLVKKVSKELPVSLTTAQLVFVFNNRLSIRFHMDEKQFEVDGAYNVRYEILKKRIDKAIVKGTGERLTQSGKIAIVWLNEIDKREYLEYLIHLQSKGYITNEIEELELEKLQGAEGLKALRVTVIDK